MPRLRLLVRGQSPAGWTPRRISVARLAGSTRLVWSVRLAASARWVSAARLVGALSQMVWCASLFVVVGCGGKDRPVSMAEAQKEYRPEDYSSVLRTWTREKSLLSVEEMDNVLTVTSTFQSWDFRQAYAARYVHDYRLTPQESKTFLERSLHTSREVHEFFVALYAQHPRWGEIADVDALWVVRLVDDTGNETAPITVDKIRKPSAMELSYFPYLTSYRKVFRITFPRATASGEQSISPRSKWFGLEFSGAQGHTTLKWALR